MSTKSAVKVMKFISVFDQKSVVFVHFCAKT